MRYGISVRSASELKSRENSFAHYTFFNYPIVLKFCTEHGSVTAVLCATFRNEWITETDVIRGCARFEYKIRFGRTFSYCTRLQPLLVRICHTWGCCNIGSPSETNFKLKSREISFVPNTRFSYQMVLKICAEHGRDTPPLWHPLLTWINFNPSIDK